MSTLLLSMLSLLMLLVSTGVLLSLLSNQREPFLNSRVLLAVFILNMIAIIFVGYDLITRTP